MKVQNYLKAAAMVLSVVLQAALPYLMQGQALTQVEIANLVVQFLGAFALYAAPTLPGVWNGYTKEAIAALTAGMVVLQTLLAAHGVGSFTPGEWAQVILAIAAAVGVVASPEVPSPPVVKVP